MTHMVEFIDYIVEDSMKSALPKTYTVPSHYSMRSFMGGLRKKFRIKDENLPHIYKIARIGQDYSVCITRERKRYIIKLVRAEET